MQKLSRRRSLIMPDSTLNLEYLVDSQKDEDKP